MSSLYLINTEIDKVTKKEMKIITESFPKDNLTVFENNKYYSIHLREIKSLSDIQIYSQDISEYVWSLINRYVPVRILYSYIENAPVEEHKYSKKNFNNFIKRNKADVD